MNKVFLLGNLGADPEVKFIQGGDAVCNLRMATTETFVDKAGEKRERTDWHSVVAWGKSAEACGKYLHKGSKVMVEGSLQTRSYDKDGEKRYATEVKAMHVEFLDGKQQGEDRDEERRQPRDEASREAGRQQRRDDRRPDTRAPREPRGAAPRTDRF